MLSTDINITEITCSCQF